MNPDLHLPFLIFFFLFKLYSSSFQRQENTLISIKGGTSQTPSDTQMGFSLMQNASWKKKTKQTKPVPLWCVIPGILLEFRKQRKQTTQQEAPRVPHIPGAGLVAGVVNSTFSPWAKFHSVFPPSKSRSQKRRKVWFSPGRRNDCCSLHGDVVFTQGRVRAGGLLGPGPASPGIASLFHILSIFPSPARQELQDVTAQGLLLAIVRGQTSEWSKKCPRDVGL